LGGSGPIEPYTLHRNPVFIATKAIYLSLQRSWERLASDAAKVPQSLALSVLTSLCRGEEQAVLGVQALDLGDYAMAISLFKRGLEELNRTLALVIGPVPMERPRSPLGGMTRFPVCSTCARSGCGSSTSVGRARTAGGQRDLTGAGAASGPNAAFENCGTVCHTAAGFRRFAEIHLRFTSATVSSACASALYSIPRIGKGD